jgi:hypothetical protein
VVTGFGLRDGVRTQRRPETSATERAIVETLAYSDVFDFPLTAEEVWQNLRLRADFEEVWSWLESSAIIDRIDRRPVVYFALPGRGSLVEIREARREASLSLWRSARTYGKLIACLPYVRMVAVTGGLAAGNSDPGDDIDFLVVTAAGRVWLARALIMAVVRLAALSGVTLCPNFLLGEDALELADRDYYSARELTQMAPIAGLSTYSRMLEVNGWWRAMLPNREPLPAPSAGWRQERPGALERMMPARVAATIEGWMFRRKGTELGMKAGPGSEAIFEASMCKGHFEGHRLRTGAEIEKRLLALGIET